ncbi:c-type cytochrome [Flavihumibacter fluvii]|uniref:c-type cytochrome n=1 Tax=Flavihumibacter fluvii TaxID=2838157 RepID=UPI001BDE0342|nr:c-type cytochrome [Flavihumibacter fluvii]ULQ54614.1 c-type cytochrome [Flavihumibacter fluvii]
MPEKISILTLFVFLARITLLAACQQEAKELPHKKVDYIRKIEGPSDSIPVLVAQRGEVLIAYSDCYECHTREVRSKGPAFTDIAKRYPVTNGYIKLLGLRVINGGSGSWGKSVMLPHPKLSPEDAETMVKYILSLK